MNKFVFFVKGGSKFIVADTLPTEDEAKRLEAFKDRDLRDLSFDAVCGSFTLVGAHYNGKVLEVVPD